MALTKVRTGGITADAVDNTILKLDDNFTFNEIAKIYLYNLNINNYEFSESEKDNLNNFFIKAVKRLSNEKN